MEEMLKLFLNNKQLFRLAAESMKARYDALLDVGFTDEQAFQLLIAQGEIKFDLKK